KLVTGVQTCALPIYCVQRGHYYAIVDEVDSILIDEARTPLIISGASEESTDKYQRVDRIIPQLTRGEEIRKLDEVTYTGDYTVRSEERRVGKKWRGE